MNREKELTAPRYQVTNFSELEPVPCPCGTTRRAFTEDPDQIASIHLVDISEEAQTHYHKKLTEIYYILEGEGEMELGWGTNPRPELDRQFLLNRGAATERSGN